MPYYMEENQLGQYWDGKQFANQPNTPKQDLSLYFKLTTKGREYEEAGCHFDGVFKCPRCRRTHNLIGNYDLLCDGCVSVTLAQSNQDLISEINRWRKMEREYFSGKPCPEILIRSFARDILYSRQMMNIEMHLLNMNF